MATRFTRWLGSTSSIVVHTLVFIFSFVLVLLGANLNNVLLILTTAVSLEAIYLAIFIQMTVNRQGESIQDVAEDIDEIQGDIDEIQEDVDEIQEDVDDIQENVEDISDDINDVTLNTIYADLKKLVDDVERFKQQNGK